MNDTVRYINQQYADHLKNFNYISKKNYNKFTTGDILIGIDRNTLKMSTNGVLNKIATDYVYLAIYNTHSKKQKIIYPENNFIFISHKEKTKKNTNKNKFEKTIQTFISKIEKSKLK